MARWTPIPWEVCALGKWLGDARKARRLTNARLGALIGYHGTAVSRACNGRTVPSWGMVAAIAVACGADIGMAHRLWEHAKQAQRTRRSLDTRREPGGRISTFDDLSAALRHLWLGSGLSQRAIAAADESGSLARSNLGAVLRGQRRPSRELTEALVRACGGDQQCVDAWTQVWSRLNSDLRRTRILAVRARRQRYAGWNEAWRRP